MPCCLFVSEFGSGQCDSCIGPAHISKFSFGQDVKWVELFWAWPDIVAVDISLLSLALPCFYHTSLLYRLINKSTTCPRRSDRNYCGQNRHRSSFDTTTTSWSKFVPLGFLLLEHIHY